MPDEWVIDPWSVDAGLRHRSCRHRGAPPARRRPSRGSTAGKGGHEIDVPAGVVRARWLVNAAGLGADGIDALLGHHDFTVTPRRGQLLVFDKLARRLVSRILLPVPTMRTKGVLVSPTTWGNVLLGPTAEDLETGPTRHPPPPGSTGCSLRAPRILPELVDEEVTAVYAGLRAATRAPRLPDPPPCRPALRDHRRHPVDRAHLLDGGRRARRRPVGRRRGVWGGPAVTGIPAPCPRWASHRCAHSRTPPESPATRPTGRRSATASR